MYVLPGCRVCLATNCKLEKLNALTKRTLAVVSDLKVELGDGFPSHLCVECNTTIKKILAFRRKARRAHFVLKEILTVKKSITTKDLEKVDRKKTNLLSPYSISDPDNCKTYSFTAIEAEEKENHTNIEETTYTGCYRFTNSVTIENINDEFEIDIQLSDKNVKPKDTDIVSLSSSSAGQIPIAGQTPAAGLNSPSLSIQTNKKETLTPNNIFVKETLKVIKNTAILTDIKTANYEEIEKEKEERRQKEIELVLDEIRQEDNVSNDNFDNTEEDNLAEEIDLNDVFKGLKEESEKEDSEEEVLEIKMPNISTKQKRDNKQKPTQVETNKLLPGVKYHNPVVKALVKSQIRYLSITEQKEIHKNKIENPNFGNHKFKCIVCLTVFPNLETLKIHSDLHLAKALLTKCSVHCEVCKNSFKTKEEYEEHCAATHWYEYTCGNCHKKHYDILDLMNCQIQSEQKFKRIPLKQREMRFTMLDQEYGPQKCKICLLGFKNKTNLSQHKARHEMKENRNNFQCDICKLVFKSKCNLELHMQQKHLYKYVCMKCRHVSWTLHRAHTHVASECVKDRHKFTCRICKKKCRSENAFLNHEKTAHRTECNVCGHSFRFLEDMYRHQFTKHGYLRLPTAPELNAPDCTCTKCNTYFVTQKALYKHLVRNKHPEVALYENGCAECAELFDTNEQLEEHRQTAHTFPRECAVRFCQEIISSESDLSTHMKTHYKTSAFKDQGIGLCEICGATCPKIYMTRHLRNYHSTEIEASCRYCHQKFTNPWSYVEHMLVQHTLKPYCCTLCDSRFTKKCDCRQHILTAHAPVLPYRCDSCNRSFAIWRYLRDHCKLKHKVNIKREKRRRLLLRLRRNRDRNKLAVYPFMKIDCTLVNQEILKLMKMELVDYLDQNGRDVDYKKYTFIDPNLNTALPSRPFPPTAEHRLRYNEEQKAQRKLQKQTKTQNPEDDFVNANDSGNVAETETAKTNVKTKPVKRKPKEDDIKNGAKKRKTRFAGRHDGI